MLAFPLMLLYASAFPVLTTILGETAEVEDESGHSVIALGAILVVKISLLRACICLLYKVLDEAENVNVVSQGFV